MGTISIGKVINSILSQIEPIKNKVFPIVSPSETTFPFLVYRRKGFEELSTKDKLYAESTLVELIIITDKYEESIELAELVRSTLENEKGIINNINVDKIEVIDAFEDFTENAYLQNLTIKIKIGRA